MLLRNLLMLLKEQSCKVEKVEEQVNDVKGEWIKAPFVGTFYAAPSANEAPYVKVGQKINKGDVICILEAMKVMNEIKSNKSGTVLEIKAQNGIWLNLMRSLS